MESREMVVMNLSVGKEQRRRHREQAYGHSGEGQGVMN